MLIASDKSKDNGSLGFTRLSPQDSAELSGAGGVDFACTPLCPLLRGSGEDSPH